MTELSPAAQAAIDAAWCETPMSPDGPYFTRCRQLAAAFKAAALRPYEVPGDLLGDDCRNYRDGVEAERQRMLAIAKELDELEPEDA